MYSTRHSTFPQATYYTTTSHRWYESRAPPVSAQYMNYDPRKSGSSHKHQRRATADGIYFGAYQQPPQYHEESKMHRSSSHRHNEHVSSSRHKRSKSNRHTHGHPTEAYGSSPYHTAEEYPTFRPQGSSHRAHHHSGAYAYPREDHGSAWDKKFRRSPSPPDAAHYHDRADAYPHGYQQTFHQAYKSSHHKRSHSFSTKHATPRPTTRGGESVRVPRQATEYDAKRAGIPSGFSMKHWDPSEEPILLLGSVFDANSLGKWIYDWTVHCHGAGTPLTEIAGDLWLLLIQLAGKIKRAEEKFNRVRDRQDRELIEEFLDSGERLWQRFNKLLKICEQYMLKSAKRHSSSSKKAAIGKDSGQRFIKCIFGRDRELERTEKIMTGIRLWSMRFDANCDEILRYA